jgi:uncharacterized membrane protein YvlD (DUF360 family)
VDFFVKKPSEQIEPKFAGPNGAPGDPTGAGAPRPAPPVPTAGTAHTASTKASPGKVLPKRLAALAAGAVAVSQTPTLAFHHSAVALRKTAWGWISHHERSLSAAGMIGGFGFDNYAFRRIDLPNTQAIIIFYLSLAALSMLVLHLVMARAARGIDSPRWRSILPVVTQFALGGLWSAFLVFYSRSAVLTASWPFLAVLAAIFIANEIFKKYHSRLVFTAVLLFFALCSYAIVTVPILTRTIGPITFVASGLAALMVFALFLRLIAWLGPQQWRSTRWWIALGVACVYAALNFFYFTGILPPLPIALADSGVYHAVAKTGDVYQAVGEQQSWTTRFGASPVMHVAPGQPLYFYSAVFAPIKLSTRIVHRWMRYDARQRKWLTVSRLSFAITGGRDGGYRAYSITHHVAPGDWRVDIDTADGHIIGRVRFTVESVPQPPAPVTTTLS